MSIYDDIGLDENLKSKSALKSPNYISAIRDVVEREQTPLINTIISRGTVRTTLGGIFEIRDINGNILLTANPTTGVVTIAGGITANVTVTVGTLTNSAITGTTSLMGTVTNTGLVSGGTLSGAIVSSGTATNMTFTSPTVTNNLIMNTSAGSGALNTTGEVAIQTSGGSALLAIRLGTQTYKFVPSGTFS